VAIELAFRCPVVDRGGLRDVDGRRWCDTCRREVHDLTEATEAEARARLAAEAGSTCATVRTDRDGRVLFRAAAAATLLAAACAGDGAPPEGDDASVLAPVAELPVPIAGRPRVGDPGLVPETDAVARLGGRRSDVPPHDAHPTPSYGAHPVPPPRPSVTERRPFPSPRIHLTGAVVARDVEDL
jgi:hypothetical protein